MMEREITAIKVQKRNPNRVSIDLDGEYAFGLASIIGAWLKVGDRLTEAKVEELIAKDTDEVVYQRALNLLNHRPRSENEIRLKLASRQFEAEQIERTISRLRNAGLVQDEKYANMWVENRNEFHPRSQRLTRFELRSKGIPDELIDTALQGSLDESELATRAAIQYAHRLTGIDWLTFRKRLSAFLARRGFSYGTIAPVVQSVWEIAES